MGRYVNEINKLHTIINNFGAMHTRGREDAAASLQTIKALTDRVTKMDNKLMQDGRDLTDRIRFIKGIEASVKHWEDMLDEARKRPDTDPFKDMRGGEVLGTLDKSKPAKAQVIQRIEEHLENESKRVRGIVEAQEAQLERMKKHIEKFQVAIATIKKVNDAIPQL